MDQYKKLLAAMFKYIFTGIITILTLGLFIDNNIIHILIISLVTTLFNYFIGTRILFKNLKANIAAIIISFLNVGIVYLMTFIFINFTYNLGVILLFSVSTAIFEYYYNKYIYTHLA